MRILQISDDLTLRIDDDGVMHLISGALQRDRHLECIGTVVIYPNEVDALIAALIESRDAQDAGAGPFCWDWKRDRRDA
jgi:hypothetical protein